MNRSNLSRPATFHSKHFLSVHVLISCCLFNVHVRVMWWYQWRGEEESLVGRILGGKRASYQDYVIA